MLKKRTLLGVVLGGLGLLGVTCSAGEPASSPGVEEAVDSAVPEPQAAPVPVATPSPAPSPAAAPELSADPSGGAEAGTTIGSVAPEPTATPVAAAQPAPRTVDLGSGATASELQLSLFSGEALSLADLKGKVVVVNFWASWCPPCRKEMSHFERTWQEYRDKGVVFVGIAVSDEEKEARAFAEKVGVTYPLAMDDTGQSARDYRVLTLPTTVLIDREGNEARKIANPANEGLLRIFIDGLLKEG